MPKFTLTVDTGNDSFQPEPAPELARILREVADKLESGRDDFGMYRTLFDSNGNDVGRAKLFTY